MNRLVATALASVAALGLLSACGDSKSSSSTTVPASALPGDTALPGETTLPGDTLPSSDVGGTVPEATIDLMIAQFEANGLKVDKACFTALLQDESMRKLVAASSGGTPSPELIQKFVSCMTP
jgi:ABC-type glycerol-3-phosphate transport system substrate-binding protein